MKKYLYFLPLTIIIVGAVLFLPTQIKHLSQKNSSTENTSGSVLYKISQAEELEPKFLNVEIDPLKVAPGSTQKMKVVMMSSQNVVSVKASIKTDNKTTDVVLSLSGEENGNPIYTAEWKVEDTHEAEYKTIFTAKNADGRENSIALTWSDPQCSASQCSFASSCNTGAAVVFCQNSNLLINNGVTVTVDNGGALRWSSGYSITLNGSLAISSGAVMTKGGYQWGKDSDTDHHRDVNTGWVYQENSPGAGWYRVDQWTFTSTQDCCDTDANTYYGQSNWFTGINACGNRDYNCNGSIEKQYNYWSANCQEMPSSGYPYACTEPGYSMGYKYRRVCNMGYPCWSDTLGAPDCGSMGHRLDTYGGCDNSWSCPVIGGTLIMQGCR